MVVVHGRVRLVKGLVFGGHVVDPIDCYNRSGNFPCLRSKDEPGPLEHENGDMIFFRNPPERLCGLLMVCASVGLMSGRHALGQSSQPEPNPSGDDLVAQYFRLQTAELSRDVLRPDETRESWEARRPQMRRQLADMLGLNPMPPRTPLNAEVMGVEEKEGYRVERLHFQPLPKLYVAANFYLPSGPERSARADDPLPTILYVCGHALAADGDTSYGNKTAYHHHGVWFAKHGYACLILDTIQRGEFLGDHHGTYRLNQWWWNNRGYTPAGVEAWTGIRALDYLESRSEVDPQRFGITGRSGGGIYSWWIAALDERIRVAVPVAGITTLHDYVVDGCVEGHCDCMFMINRFRWDYPQVAALVAPRPLLISNSDKDNLFPLEGVLDVHRHVRDVYRLYDADEKLGLQITEGPHRDTQELRVHAFRWFNRFLKDDESLLQVPAEKSLTPGSLKVFERLPTDERVTSIQESFVAKVDVADLPESLAELTDATERWKRRLLRLTFAGWPAEKPSASPLEAQPIDSRLAETVHIRKYAFTSQLPYRFAFYVLSPAEETFPPKELRIKILAQDEWDRLGPLLTRWMNADDGEIVATEVVEAVDEVAGDGSGAAVALFAPRGVGPTRWGEDERERIHIRRRFNLLGQTADSMRIWDVRRLLQAIEQIEDLRDAERILVGSGDAAAWALYASLFEPNIAALHLHELPARNRDGVTLLNVSRVVETPHVVLAASRSVPTIRITDSDEGLRAWRALIEKGLMTRQQLELKPE